VNTESLCFGNERCQQPRRVPLEPAWCKGYDTLYCSQVMRRVPLLAAYGKGGSSQSCPMNERLVTDPDVGA
jgi:hypothetical protein